MISALLRIRGVQHVTINADHRATVVTEQPDDWQRVSAALTAAGIIDITDPVVLEDEE